MSLDQNPKTLQLKPTAKLQLQDYEILKALGEGSFGKVYIVKHKLTGAFWAFKQLKKYDIIKSKQVDHLKNEVQILNSLTHPLIVKMAGITQDSKFLYIGMEFIPGGELFTYLRRVVRFPRL